MKVESLLNLRPVTLGITGIVLTDGNNLVDSLVNMGAAIDPSKRLTIKIAKEALQAFPPEIRDQILDWEVDEESEAERIPQGFIQGLNDPVTDASLKHSNSIYGWTLCITTLILAAPTAYSIFVEHVYPKPIWGVILILPVTLAVLYLIGALKQRQSLLSVILGDTSSKESVGMTVIKAIANRGSPPDQK